MQGIHYPYTTTSSSREGQAIIMQVHAVASDSYSLPTDGWTAPFAPHCPSPISASFVRSHIAHGESPLPIHVLLTAHVRCLHAAVRSAFRAVTQLHHTGSTSRSPIIQPCASSLHSTALKPFHKKPTQPSSIVLASNASSCDQWAIRTEVLVVIQP